MQFTLALKEFYGVIFRKLSSNAAKKLTRRDFAFSRIVKVLGRFFREAKLRDYEEEIPSCGGVPCLLANDLHYQRDVAHCLKAALAFSVLFNDQGGKVDADATVATSIICAIMCCNAKNNYVELTSEERREPGLLACFRQLGKSVSATRLLSMEVVDHV